MKIIVAKHLEIIFANTFEKLWLLASWEHDNCWHLENYECWQFWGWCLCGGQVTPTHHRSVLWHTTPSCKDNSIQEHVYTYFIVSQMNFASCVFFASTIIIFQNQSINQSIVVVTLTELRRPAFLVVGRGLTAYPLHEQQLL